MTQTVGAGDCFVGAFVVSVVDERGWAEALKIGAAAAALHVEETRARNGAVTMAAKNRATVGYPPAKTAERRGSRRQVALSVAVLLVTLVGWWL